MHIEVAKIVRTNPKCTYNLETKTFRIVRYLRELCRLASINLFHPSFFVWCVLRSTSMLSSLLRRHNSLSKRCCLPSVRLITDEKNSAPEPITLAPLVFDYPFQKVFSDKLNMRYLLNNAMDACRMRNRNKIVTIHNIETSKITTNASLENCESTTMYDCCCTFTDGSMGIFKLIKTQDTSNIERDVADCAKLDYWKQWKEHNAFRYPVRVLVLDVNKTLSSEQQSFPWRRCVENDVRHACSNLHYHPPVVEYGIYNIWYCPPSFARCSDDFARWCRLIGYSYAYDIHDLPAILKLQPFHRAVQMLEISKFVPQEYKLLIKECEDLMHLQNEKRVAEWRRKDSVIEHVLVLVDVDTLPDE